ncbi:hypothetical protein KC19_9G131700 [Ceratodon purpureus]|uniref:Uncharacterized protein n=1 Tax=Ceratodon purpureus TaxID=3225 RepID=A0A8T0GVU9_CERPU|nr:hypothetical protein KC19_9G131700 [Ceratodon purpureus]
MIEDVSSRFARRGEVGRHQRSGHRRRTSWPLRSPSCAVASDCKTTVAIRFQHLMSCRCDLECIARSKEAILIQSSLFIRKPQKTSTMYQVYYVFTGAVLWYFVSSENMSIVSPLYVLLYEKKLCIQLQEAQQCCM